MNNGDLADRIAAEAKVTKGTAKLVVESIFGEIAKAAARGEEVSIHGFGKFIAKDRAPRAGRNPRTGEAMQIPAAKSVKFVAAQALKARVND
jgi:DNA-binding protein HU-beta